MGFIVPAINVIAEDDFIAMAPPDVGVHFARADVDRGLPLQEQFQQMVDAAPRLAASLAKAGVQVCAFACTSASFFKGVGFDQAIARSMQAASGIECMTTSTAVLEALQAVEVRRIGLATPYVQWVVDAERQFFTQSGLEVVAANGLERHGGSDINTIDDETIRAQALAVALPSSDAVFISCTDLPSLALVESLEQVTGRPVITSNQATFWACARRLGIGPIANFGGLLSRHLS
jgi:maleate cis-trans isomerase